MTRDQLEKIEELFHTAADLPAGERAAYLDAACSPDGPAAGLRARVEAMLVEHDGGGTLGAPDLPRLTGAEDDLPEAPGSRIGRYKLLQKIGEGGFGVVYMAEQTEPVVRRVALKIIKLGMDTREVVARFEAERQALALMDHPNIARVLDGGATDSGRPYFVMELVRGVSITEYCDRNQLSPAARLALFVPVCHAVQHAHHKGVIHRDIKPSNVMVTLHDGSPMPKVIDFGVAKAMHTRLTEKTLFTAYERFIGTPAYMSPEQAELSALDVDTRTDIYSLGVLLYELLTGTTPFDVNKLFERGIAAVRDTIREEPPERPSVRISTTADATAASQRGADAPALEKLVRGDLDWIVMKCLEKERVRRYETASELAADIERHLRNDPVLAGPPSRSYRLRKFLARNRAAVASGTLLFLALVGGVIGTTIGMVEAARQRDEAVKLEGVARSEAERTQAVTDFLVDTLALTDPDVALDAGYSVARLLSKASTEIEGAFHDQPDAEARVRITIGRALKALGEDELAEHHLRRAVELVRDDATFDQELLYGAMWDLTHVLFNLEREDSLAAAMDARRVAHDIVRASHPELAAALDRFIEVVNDAAFSMDSTAAAELPDAFDEATRAADTMLTPNDPLRLIVADTWMAAGYSLWYGPLEHLIEPIWGEALEVHQRLLPPSHPQIAETTGLYVSTLTRQGKDLQAEEAVRESLAHLHAVLPDDSPQIALNESMLGDILTAQGRYAEAEPFLVRSHARLVGALAEDTSFRVSESFARVISMYDAWGKPEQARPYRRGLARLCADAATLVAWPMARLVPGPEHAELGALMERMEAMCGGFAFGSAHAESRPDELGEVLDALLAARRESVAPGDPLNVLVCRQLLAWANALAPGVAAPEKRRMIEEALDVLAPHEERLSDQLAVGHAELAELLAAQGETERAREQGLAAWRLLQDVTSGWLLAGRMLRVGRILLGLELFEEAESLLRTSHASLLAHFGERNTEVRRARELLVELYTRWGRPEEARGLPPAPRPEPSMETNDR